MNDVRPIVTVLVQGDLMQSPRMLAHAESLAENGYRVRLLGYASGTPPHENLPAGIDVIPIEGIRRLPMLPAWLFMPLAALRSLLMTVRLRADVARALDGATAVLVQVPPSVPLLGLVLRAARRTGARVVVDWHNYAHAMLGLRLGPRSVFVRMVASLEGQWGRQADHHFCVTSQMQADLKQRWGIRAEVLPDRPRTSLPVGDTFPDRHRMTTLVARLTGGSQTAATWLADPASLVVICPTSWSQDEHTDHLLELCASWRGPLRLVILATGRGPGREAFERRLRLTSNDRALLLTGWLSRSDYAELLWHCDAGISLHHSASGLDFPMKIVDMIAAGLPVLALDYGPALSTSLPAAPAAHRFTSLEELGHLLIRLGNAEERARARRAARGLHTAPGSWSESWQQIWLAMVPKALSK